MKKIHNSIELKAETYRLKLEQQKLLKEIRTTWEEIKQKDTPSSIATELAIDIFAGKSLMGKILTSATDILQRYSRKNDLT
jgi:hypothetical protein